MSGENELSKEVFDVHLQHIRQSLHDIRNGLAEIPVIREELMEQNKTLFRNTLTLEEHVKRTNLLEKKMSHVEDEVDGLKTHLIKVQTLLSILKPTKEKIKWLIILASLMGGGYQLTSTDGLNKTIEVIERAFSE